MRKLFGSKKGSAMIVGIVTPIIVLMGQKFGLSEEMAMKIAGWIVQIASIYIGGQALADGFSGGATSSSPSVFDAPKPPATPGA